MRVRVRLIAPLFVVLVGAMLAACTTPQVSRPGQPVAAAPSASAAFEALQDAALQGNPDAQFALAQAYEVGRPGVPVDQVKAFTWYSKAANAGHVPAQFFLGAMYASSRGTDLNIPMAVFWYRKAADKGYPDALYPMGYVYEYGLGGVARDQKQALAWYQKSADAGNAFANQRLANAYRMGDLGLTPDPERASELEAKVRLGNKGQLLSLPVGRQ